MTTFTAKLKAPGGQFTITENGVTYASDDGLIEWGFPSLQLAQVYFHQLLKTILLAQEAAHGRRT